MSSSGPEPPPPAPGLFEAAADAEATAQAVAAAAPIAVERADIALLHTLDPALHEPVYRLLSSLADNKYVLGRRYAEWCTGAPMLESAVAAAAMAQDELGHARSFYPLLRAFPMDRGAAAMEERGWQTRPTHAMACLDRRFDAWADYIAANVLVDTALTTLLERGGRLDLRAAAPASAQDRPRGGRPLGPRQRLAAPPGASEPMQAAIERMWHDAFNWFGMRRRRARESNIVSADPETLRDVASPETRAPDPRLLLRSPGLGDASGIRAR